MSTAATRPVEFSLSTNFVEKLCAEPIGLCASPLYQASGRAESLPSIHRNVRNAKLRPLTIFLCPAGLCHLMQSMLYYEAQWGHVVKAG
jgi:hypothetical protein